VAHKSRAEIHGEEHRRFRHSFFEGCANCIYERLEQMRLAAQTGCMKANKPNNLRLPWRTLPEPQSTR
jgi:hypothetical protein